ncbi:MAG: class I SAM-dependent methyltransferase family protein [Desulfobacterales bacterium]|nr:class I SAM-dependent methyltransferase family protein [Deltaproteobacteria bacterium]NNK97008.1 class I SAM-dependent methyltransferase family protein [Desulfobacterales bacterium]
MNLKQALNNKLPSAELDLLVRAYDVVGDIAVIIIPPELFHRKTLIGQTLLDLHKNVKVVAKRSGVYEGQHRTIDLTILAGENRTETIHKEFGVKLLLDLRTIYFSARIGTERKRIADLVAADEKVLVMFSGAAPFPLVIGRHSHPQAITGIEISKIAHAYGKKNLRMNTSNCPIKLINGDVRDVVTKLNETFDRIIMPLPHTAQDFLHLALALLRDKGWLHYYDIKPKDHFQISFKTIQDACNKANRCAVNPQLFFCGHISPKLFRICIDVQIV